MRLPDSRWPRPTRRFVESWTLRHRLIVGLLLAVVACTPGWYSGRAELPDCGEERLENLDGPFNEEARKCFAEAVEAGEPAEFRVFGFNEHGGKLNRTARNLPDGSAEEIVESGELGWSRYECSFFEINDGPKGLPNPIGVDCTPAPVDE